MDKARRAARNRGYLVNPTSSITPRDARRLVSNPETKLGSELLEMMEEGGMAGCFLVGSVFLVLAVVAIPLASAFGILGWIGGGALLISPIVGIAGTIAYVNRRSSHTLRLIAADKILPIPAHSSVIEKIGTTRTALEKTAADSLRFDIEHDLTKLEWDYAYLTLQHSQLSQAWKEQGITASEARLLEEGRIQTRDAITAIVQRVNQISETVTALPLAGSPSASPSRISIANKAIYAAKEIQAKDTGRDSLILAATYQEAWRESEPSFAIEP